MKYLILFFCFICSFCAFGLAYLSFVEENNIFQLSNDINNWGSFGSYIGGVLSVIFSAGSLFLVIYSLNKQDEHFFELESKRDHLIYLERLESDIDKWIDSKLAYNSVNENFITFYALVYGLIENSEYIQQNEYKRALSRLVKLLANYINGYKLYCDNVNTNFVARYHVTKITTILDFLEKNDSLLTQNEKLSLVMMKNHLQKNYEEESWLSKFRNWIKIN